MALSILLISACSGLVQDKKNAPTLFTDFYETSEYLLQKAEAVKEPNNTGWQLAGIQALTKEGKYVLAESVIEYLENKSLNIQQKNHLLLLTADNQYAQNQLDKTMVSIKNIDMSVLSDQAKLHYLTLKAELHVRKKEHQSAVDTLLKLTPLLKVDDQKQQYNDLLLTELNMLDSNALNKYNKTPLTNDEIFVQGWYALGSIYHRYQLRTNQLTRGVEAWKLLYPSHPAIAFMPSQLLNLAEATPYQPSKIAVLLPLTGRFKKPAQAIQYGISYAFYNQSTTKKQLLQDQENGLNSTSIVSADGDVQEINQTVNSNKIIERDFVTAPPNLLFIDTNKMTMQEIADQLHSQNIDFVIGPLLKPNLKTFLPLVKDIPVLALNGFPTVDNSPTSSIHYAFPLSPEGEAEQAAEVIFNDNHKKPLIFSENSDFGKRSSAAFEARWNELSRMSDNSTEIYPAETHFFSKNTDYGKFIADALPANQSKKRNSKTTSAVRGKSGSQARKKGDVDAIYIISKRKQLIFIKSFMSVALSPFAKEISLYASSRGHVKDVTKSQDKDLTGVTFSDVAFLMEDKAQMNQKIQTVWPKQRLSTLRLFALGHDSYNLIERLKLLEVIEGYKYDGLVGEITLDANNTIKSKLSWAKFKDGSLVEVTSPISSQ